MNTVLAKLALTIGGSDKGRRTIAWILAAVLSPLILITAVLCSLASGGAEQSLWKLLCIGGAAVLCFCALCRMAACVRRMLRERAIRMRERCYWRARLAAQKQAQ